MLLLIFGFVAVGLLLRIVWFLWSNRDIYFGTDNRHRSFASKYKDFAVYHNAKTLPMKTKLFESLHELNGNGSKGVRILEIGTGNGVNFQFFPKNTKFSSVDPNPYFQKDLLENIKKFPDVTLDKLLVTGAENMKDIPDKSIDAVVSTLVLCSCPHVQQVYQEICRVLVPGGQFYFMEHVIDDQLISMKKILQILLSSLGIFQFFIDGCRCDKDLEKELRKARFSKVEVKRFTFDTSECSWRDWPVFMIQPHLYGTATAPRYVYDNVLSPLEHFHYL